MSAISLLTNATCLFFLFFGIFLIPGLVVLARAKTRERDFPFIFSLAISSGLIAMIVVVCTLLRPLFPYSRWVLFSALALFLFLFLYNRTYRAAFDCSRGESLGLFFIFYLFASFYVNASIEDSFQINAHQVSLLLDLPIDNLIPFNTARFFLEGISPMDREVVPGWNVLDRGLLSGLLTAGVFIILGIKEFGFWLHSDSQAFFAFEQLLIFLNSFSIVAVWELGRWAYGRKEAALGVAFLLSLCCFLINVIFSWPKFFMAVLLLASLLFAAKNKQFIVGGAVFSLALFAHESALFCLPGFVLALKFVPPRKSWQETVLFISPIIFYLGFWALVKNYFAVDSTRMLVLHLMCNQTSGALNQGRFFPEYFSYLSGTPLKELLLIRLSNLTYPLNPLVLFEAEIGNVATFMRGVAHLSFYQLIFTILPGGIILAGLSLRAQRDFTQHPGFLQVVIGILSSHLVVSAIMGCARTTANHHWAYPIILLISVLVGGQARASKGSLMLYLFALLCNFWVYYVKIATLSGG